jgi:hypothetical protein
VNRQESFDHRVDEWVAIELATGADFDELVQRLPGVYPSIILTALSRLAVLGLIPPTTFQSALRRAKTGKRKRIGMRHSLLLPIPHPLDFDWRFSAPAAADILESCARLTKPSDTIALLGAPSLLRHAHESGYPRRVVLLDSNPALRQVFPSSSHLQYVHCRIPSGVPRDLHAAVVVVDPPWYEAEMKEFLWAASQLCTAQGHVLMSVPPEGTRPTIDVEWERILRYAQSCGFALEQLERLKYSYATPPFELNALQAEGIQNVPADWRRSHCAVLSRRSACRIRRPRPAKRTPWHEITIRRVRIRVRSVDTGALDPRLIRLVDGDILPSVSRRDKRRRQAVVWTSGNRVFGCAAPSALTIILQAISEGSSPLSQMESTMGRRLSSRERQFSLEAIAQVQEVIEIEVQENARFVEYGDSCLTRVHFSSIGSQQSQRKILTGMSV